jgi:hypothetical protein
MKLSLTPMVDLFLSILIRFMTKLEKKTGYMAKLTASQT